MHTNSLLTAAAALLFAVPALAATPQAQPGATKAAPVGSQPSSTGSMYNGNNTKPSSLHLQGRMAPITRDLESSNTAQQDKGAATSTSTTQGGNSKPSRGGSPG